MGCEMGRTAATAMTIRIIHLITLVYVLLLIGCGGSSQEKTLLHDESILRPGDLVFRRGTGLVSHTVMLADNDGSYSHVGIVADSSGVMMVIHAVPGEPDYEGDPDRVKMEPAMKFFNTINASLGEICRQDDPEMGKTAADAALAIYHRGTLFDHKYNDQDTVKMYCTQLVMECYRKAGCELTGPPSHSFELPGLKCTCWLPSDLYHSTLMHSVCILNQEWDINDHNEQ